MAQIHRFISLLWVLIVASSVYADPWAPCGWPGQFLPDTDDCSAYYVCDGRYVAQYFHCDVGLEYSVYTSNCVTHIDCFAGSRPPFSTTNTPPYTGTAPPGVFCTIPGDMYPDPYDCTVFWFCDTNMIATPVDCGNLYYNVYAQTCDYPPNVDCTNGYRPPTTTGYPTTTTSPATISIIHTPPPEVVCSYPDELIPDPDDCTVYWNCFGGTYPIYEQCQGGLYYNPGCLCCDFPANVDCVNGVRPPTTQSPATGTPTVPSWVNCGYAGEHIPDRSDCQTYYVCTLVGGDLVPIYYKCTEGLEFNSITNTCDYPSNVDCNGGIRPTDAPTGPSPTGTYPTGLPCGACGYPGEIMADCYDCTAFYICDGNMVPQYKHCADGLYYNDIYQNCALTSTCAWTSPRPPATAAPTTLPSYITCSYIGQMIADKNNCQMYYYCIGINPPYTADHRCCAPTLRYNDVTDLCDTSAAVTCGTRPDDPGAICPDSIVWQV